MNEFIKPKVRVTVGIGSHGTVYHESRAVVGGERNHNNISVSKAKNVNDNIDELKVLAKSYSDFDIKANSKGEVSGVGLVAAKQNGQIVKISENDKFVDSNSVAAGYISVAGPVKVPNYDFKPVEVENGPALINYYNDGTGHLYGIAKLVELCKDLVPFDAPIQAFDLSPDIWRGCSILELAHHVKQVNEADLDFPIILDWNGGLADGRHRLIKALVLGHSTIKCVRMTYKPNFDKLMD